MLIPNYTKKRLSAFVIINYVEIAQLVSSRWTENPEIMVRFHFSTQKYQVEVNLIETW